jgi:hypothetical protein
LNKFLEADFINKIKIIKKASLFINDKNNFYYDSSLNYLDSLGDTPGYGLTQYWYGGVKKLPLLFFFVLKDFLKSFYIFDYYMKGKVKKNYKNIIISCSNIKNFKKDGSYYDPYFNSKSNFTKDCLWFLIHLDKKIPKKISNNLIIIYRSKSKFQFIKLFIFLISLPKIISNFNLILHKQSFQTIMAYKIYGKFKNFLNSNVKKIFLPYEGQPFQNLILKKTKDFKKKINTFGFIHNFPPPLPTNLIFRNSSPDKLIMSGVNQKLLLIKYLNWNKKKIIVAKSARFIDDKKDMADTIFLASYLCLSKKIIKQKIEYIFLNLKGINNRNFKIKNHPDKTDSNIHLNLIDEIKSLLRKNRKKNIQNEHNYNNKISIIIGATGAVIEALETEHEVIHIVGNSILHTYCGKLYPNISCTFISQNIYKYKINKKNLLINFGKKNLTFQTYLKY